VSEPRDFQRDFLAPQTKEGIELLIKKMIELKILDENINFRKEFIYYLKDHMKDVSPKYDGLITLIEAYIHPKWVNTDQLMSMGTIFYAMSKNSKPTGSDAIDNVERLMRDNITRMRSSNKK
jgi:hypothetical protein